MQSGGVKTKRHVGSPHGVVDCLRKRHNRNAFLAQKVCRLVRAVAAQNDEAVELHLLEVLLHGAHFVHVVFLNHTHLLERLTRSAQNGAAERENAGKILLLHFPVFPRD